MHSVKTKITSLMLCCALLTALAVLAVGIGRTKQVLEKDSAQIFELLCSNTAFHLDETLRDIEQSVNILYQFAVKPLSDSTDIFDENIKFETYIEEMHEISLAVAENTPGSIGFYYRFSPEIASSAGFFMTKPAGQGEFFDVPVTDIERYAPDDHGHVGWYYEPLEAGRPVWIDPYENENIGVRMISYVAPVCRAGKPVGVLGMDIDIGVLRDAVQDIPLYETGYAILIDARGNILYHPSWPEGLMKGDFSPDIARMVSLMEENSGQAGLQQYDWNGVSKLMTAQRLANGMTFAITAPKREIDAPMRTLIVQATLLTAAILAAALPLIFRTAARMVKPLRQLTSAAQKIARGELDVSIQCDTKDEVGVLAESFRQTAGSLREYIGTINRLAYTDALTGIGNKTAYESAAARIEDALAHGEGAFAVVQMDLNDLKLLNDTCGHEKGDMMIRDAANIIKNVFGVSAVFRTGGDEFAAILTGEKLERHRELLRSLGEEIEDFNQSSGKGYGAELKVARGMAVFDARHDSCFADVVRRADAMMYQHKKQMKEQK